MLETEQVSHSDSHRLAKSHSCICSFFFCPESRQHVGIFCIHLDYFVKHIQYLYFVPQQLCCSIVATVCWVLID